MNKYIKKTFSIDKDLELKKIAKEIAKCKECRKNTYGLPVPGEGNSNTKIIFIGMCPGLKESKIGKPFIGKSGKFLTQLLKWIGIKREDVYITSPVKYYPGKRTLTKKEIQHGMIHTYKQIRIIKPKLIVLLGNIALQTLLEKKDITKIHGKFIKKGKIVFLPTFHPAAGIRFPKIKKEMEKDFLKIRKFKYVL